MQSPLARACLVTGKRAKNKAKRFMRHGVQHQKKRGALTIIILVVSFGVLCIASVAQAQDQDPLRMVVVNASERGGEQPRSQLVSILEDNEAIELIESEDVLAVMEDFGVNEKILRKQALRAKFKSRISRMTRAQRIEGMLIVDTYNKGRTLQVVVLGPDGEEIQDVRRKIKGGRLKQDTAIGVLQDVFPVLGPDQRDVLKIKKNLEAIEEKIDAINKKLEEK